MNTDILANFRNAMAKLYPDEFSIRQIAADAGLDLGRIDLNSTPINNWHNVLIEAEIFGRIDILLDVAEKEYVTDLGFQTVLSDFRQELAESIHHPEPYISAEFDSGVSGKQIWEGESRQRISIELRKVLADLGIDQSSIFRILEKADIDRSRIVSSSGVKYTWYSIFNEAQNIERTDALLDVVEGEFPSNLYLQDLISAYRRAPAQISPGSLPDILAGLYPDRSSILRVIADAGIDSARIELSSTAIKNWRNVLAGAERLGLISTLLKVVESEYGRNRVLQNALNAYQQIAEQLPYNQLDEWSNEFEHTFTHHSSGAKIDLSMGLLATVSVDFWQQRDFTILDLSSNQLEQLPSDLHHLNQLTLLNLSSNQLQTFPTILFDLPNLTELYMGNNGLTMLPAEIVKLHKLRRLFLSGNELTTLPETISLLSSLEELELNDNGLTTLPASIGNLSLENLHLRGNKFTELGTIVYLSQLRLLDLDSNQLTELPSQLDQLRNLSILRLRGNHLSQLPKSFLRLRNLTILDIRRNLFQRFPAAIAHLSELHTLLASDNKLTSLPSDFARLQALKRLDLANNQLKSLPSGITGLTELIQLDLTGNQLTALPKDIDRWSNLEELLVSDNRLPSLPVGLAQLTRLRRLDLRNNLLPIPEEVLSQTDDPAAIITYYMTHQTGASQALNEAKMLIVGQGSVGKTSLVRRLAGNPFNEHEAKTAGIAVTPWPLKINHQSIRVNIWDFGGQEIMHATHQFFLTRRSLYLLVLNVREDERANRLEYWLKIIQSFGSDSPVIIVGNKADEHPLDINMAGLQAKYPNIRGFIHTSCLTSQGLTELAALIKQEIAKLDHVQSKILVNWFAVKQALEGMHHVDYLPYADYVALCQQRSVEDPISQRTLLELLHQLGVVLCYQEDPRLQDTNILNPEWVTNGVYTVLNANLLFQQRGILERRQLQEILDPVRYPAAKHSFLIDLMRKFELCFDLDGHLDQKFLVPDLLYWEDLDTGHWADALPFRYDYDVLPGSILTRFIVKMHNYIHQHTCWRTGVVLAHEGNRALVKGDIEDRCIYIWVDGPLHGRSNFLSIIRFQFDSIHKTIPGIKAAEKVPLPQHPGVVVDYHHLLTLERLNEETFIPEGLSERISVRTLLDGVVPEEERRSERVVIPDKDGPTPPPVAPAPTTARVPESQNPWRGGSFYLTVFVVVIGMLVFAANYTDSYVLPMILIAALLAIPLIGVLHAFNEGTLTEKGFLQVIVETFQRLPLLKGRSDRSSGEN